MHGVDSFIEARWYKRGRSGRAPVLWIVHDEEYPERPDSAERVGAYFATVPRTASAHACVDSNSIVGCVDWNNTAYHAGHSATNLCSIGIEHSGYAHQTREQWLDAYGLAMLDLSARLFADVGSGMYRIPPYRLTSVQIRAAVAGTGPGGICSHGDITRAFSIRGGHTDPGANFPWDWYLARCQAYSTGTPIDTGDDDVSYSKWSKTDKEAFWADFKLFGAPVITGSQVATTKDKQTNLGDVVNAINAK